MTFHELAADYGVSLPVICGIVATAGATSDIVINTCSLHIKTDTGIDVGFLLSGGDVLKNSSSQVPFTFSDMTGGLWDTAGYCGFDCGYLAPARLS